MWGKGRECYVACRTTGSVAGLALLVLCNINGPMAGISPLFVRGMGKALEGVEAV